MSSKELIKVTNAYFAFGKRPIFKDLSLTVPAGKISAVMGPSGCGKSTLLSFIGGRLFPSSGDVVVDGQHIPSLDREDLYALRKRVGMMFQASALLTDLTVFENVAFPIREHTDLPEPLINDLVITKLHMVGLRGARDLYPAELSGGMARRVALARAIALDPMLVMYDEPFTGLDPISKGVIVKLIRDINDALGMTSVVVTHDVEEGLSIADHVFLLGEGRVLAEGSPAALRESKVPGVMQFISGLPDGPVAYHYPAVDYIDDLMGANKP